MLRPDGRRRRSDWVNPDDFASASAYIAKKTAPEGDCWRWTGQTYGTGYGALSIRSRASEPAHRFAYRTYRADIPEGLVLDHLCRNKACVNPWHLEPVTQAENMRRYSQTLEECPSGHAYDEANTYWTKREGWRQCRACHRARQRERRRLVAT